MADIKKQPSPVTQTTWRSGRTLLGTDRRGNRPAHALVIGRREVAARAGNLDGF